MEQSIRLVKVWDINVDRMRWHVLGADQDWPAAIDVRLELNGDELDRIYQEKYKQLAVGGMNLTPILDRIIVRRIEAKQVGAIIIPEAHKDKSTLVEIVAVGPGRYREGYFEPTTVKPGQKALIGEFVDSELANGLTVIMEQDIRALVDA